MHTRPSWSQLYHLTHRVTLHHVRYEDCRNATMEFERYEIAAPTSLANMAEHPALEKASSGKDLESVTVDEVLASRTSSYSREEERRMVRKMDVRILPALGFMYLCNALDRGNVGNAKTDGWDKDVGLKGNQYYTLVMVFYVPFCLFGTPISVIVKKYSAARVIPILMLGYVSKQLKRGSLLELCHRV
ncbi:hypothetical protein OE88DRAFT_95771 [Heliocybe sulcata]|uniref:MFS general substrate transporter n=1 Tax=Heliocybe sulcata TaxID=5364 RepID=A0A5C3NIN2_9AGAM|nr:hypothetical protein OE88DRAFT_95771 [Heliocybe sulcata]